MSCCPRPDLMRNSGQIWQNLSSQGSLTFIRGLAGMLISLHLAGLVPRLHQNNHMNPLYNAWNSKVDVLRVHFRIHVNNS